MRFCFANILILFSLSAEGAELYRIHTSVRALGMGDAYSAIVSDKDALFYNPANLALIEGLNWTIIDPYVGVNGQDVIDISKDLTSTGDTSSQFATTLKKMFGKKIWIGTGFKSAFAFPYFAVAGYEALTGSAYLSNPAFPNFNVNFINDLGFAAGVAFSMGPGLSMGVTGKKIQRTGAAFPIGVSTLAALSSTDLQDKMNNRGNGYSIDYGLTLTIPTPVKPTFSFVWHDIGRTTFTQDVGATPPPAMKDEMSVGYGMHIDLPGLDIRPTAEMRYLNWPEEQLGKKIHFGIEFALPIVSLRAGLYQGYYTAGAGVSLGVLKFDVATYGVELGEYPGQHEDRRYIAQLTLQLGFDPSLGFLRGGSSSGGSGGSRVKSRR